MEESKLVKGRTIMDAATVAAAGYAATVAGRPLAIPGLQNQLQTFLTRLLPLPTLAAIVRNAQERARGN
jgi:short-subunit dehydrogenase